jgi:type IV pilus assembly protein PilE
MTRKTAVSGFTLIELMIAVAIVAIIAGIAFPSYMESVRKSNRADAKSELSDVAQRLQRCFTAYSSYNNAACGVAAAVTDPNTITSREGFYEISGVIDAATYTLTATPIAGTTQDNDAKCTAFSLNQAGARTATGSLGNDCW